MAVRKVISDFNSKIIARISDRKDMLKADPDGLGLATPQIKTHLPVGVVCFGGHDAENCAHAPSAPVNPAIGAEANVRLAFDGRSAFQVCLLRPPIPISCERLGRMSMAHLLKKFEDFVAVMVHHEIDDLEGVLWVDRISRKEDLFLIQLSRERRLAAPSHTTGHAGPHPAVRQTWRNRFCTGLSFVSCRRPLGLLVNSRRLHLLRLFRSVPFWDILPSTFVSRTAQSIRPI